MTNDLKNQKLPKDLPRVQLMSVTPDRALHWLDNANTRNRRLSEAYAEKLARDMRQDRWLLTHEGIAFDPHGVLLDGQHRLWAVVLADRTVEMYVWFDVTSEALMAINNGKSRSTVDILRLAGRCGNVTGPQISTLRALLAGYGKGPTMTCSEAAEAYDRHRDAISFALDHLPVCLRAKGVPTATTRGVIARGWYSANRAKLAAFCEMIISGVVTDPNAGVIVLLRQYLMDNRGGSYELRRERYGKTQRALRAYLRGESITRLYSAGREYFPLPEENES